MGSGQVFDHLIDELKSFCNPITIDLAGHGKTQSPDNPKFYTAERQVHQVISVVKRLAFSPLYLYGYSMGGRLAFQLLAEDPNLFSGAIIESSHCGIESEIERLSRKELDEKRARQIENDFENFIEEWNNMPLFQHTPPKLRSVYKNIMKQQNPEKMASSLRGFGSGVMPAVCNQIQKIDIPIHFVAGSLDVKYVNTMSDLNNRLGSGKLHIIESAGHRVHTDQPKKLIQIVKKTLT